VSLMPVPAFASGEIDGSLYVAAREAGLSDRLAMEMVGIFGWNIDFVYDVRKGDRFEVVYEELYLDGEKFDTGDIPVRPLRESRRRNYRFALHRQQGRYRLLCSERQQHAQGVPANTNQRSGVLIL